MNNYNKYNFVIDNIFINRVNRAFFMIFLWFIVISFFLYHVFTSKAWVIYVFGVNISLFYLPPIIFIIPTLHEDLMMIIKYGTKSFKNIDIVDNKIIGKNFLNQKILIESPIVIDWDFFIRKTWYMSKNDEIFQVSFIKISQGDKILFIPHSKANLNFIKKLQEISQ